MSIVFKTGGKQGLFLKLEPNGIIFKIGRKKEIFLKTASKRENFLRIKHTSVQLY